MALIIRPVNIDAVRAMSGNSVSEIPDEGGSHGDLGNDGAGGLV